MWVEYPQTVLGDASSGGRSLSDYPLDEPAKIRSGPMPVDANGVLNRRVDELLFAGLVHSDFKSDEKGRG